MKKNQSEVFYDTLVSLKKYKWRYKNEKIVGVGDKSGDTVNPILAVHRKLNPNGPRYSNSYRDATLAARRLGLPQSYVDACMNNVGRVGGNSVIVRRKIKSVLSLV